jgi:putative membrane protein insertion efficiency factor
MTGASRSARRLARGRRVLWIAGWPIRLALIGLIRLYRLSLSGLLGGHCRFEPTCSRYAEAAIRARGAVAGSVLAVWRIARCNPFARGGRDEPPRRAEYANVIHRAGSAS